MFLNKRQFKFCNSSSWHHIRNRGCENVEKEMRVAKNIYKKGDYLA